MKQVILAFIFILLVVLILYLRKEKYTMSDVAKIDAYFHSDGIKGYIVNSCLNEIGQTKDLELSNVNLLVDSINSSNGYTFTHYSNVSELDTMFETAYTSGESSLGSRDRMILRAFAYPGIEISTSFKLSNSYTAFTYTADGVPDYTSTILSETGKTRRELLNYCFEVLSKLFSGYHGQNPWTPDVIDYVNSTIPDRYAPKFDRTNNMSVGIVFEATTVSTPAGIWLMKALSVGPAYLAWLAENKWHLDLDWHP